MSVLAAAGERGMSRDKLVALFWPEADSERGRHALTQALYVARRSLRCDDLFIVGADVRLNPERMGSDVADFEAALPGDPAAAVALYRGPFLDGFFFSGSPGFEQWCSSERARIEAEVVGALERLGDNAAEAGDLRRSAEWWRKAAALRPYDSGIALRLMQALSEAGDRAGALQHASIHGALLREELAIEPDPAVMELATALRDRTPASDQVGDRTPAPAVAEYAPPVRAIPEAVASRAAAGYGPVQVWTRPHRPARWRALVVVGLAGAAMLIVGIIIGYGRRSAPRVAALAERQRVVVAPFRTVGAAPSLTFLRDGMVELLSTRLADDSAARSVDAGAVIGAWRAAGLAPAMDVPRETIVKLAARLGAERVVVGAIVGSPRRVVIRATALRVSDGAVVGQAVVEGSSDSLTSLVDRLAARLLLAEAGEADRLGAHLTVSLPALRVWLGGQDALRRNDYAAAMRRFVRALELDSTFALAAVQLAVAADRADDASLVTHAVSRAWPFADRLTDRDRALLAGFAGPRYPDASPGAEQLAAWQRAADLAPASAEAWYALGARLYHDGAVAGVADWRRRAAAALRRALTADSTFAPAVHLLAAIDVMAPESGALDARVAIAAYTDSLDPLAPALRWLRAAAAGDTAALRAARAELARLGPANLRTIAMASMYTGLQRDDGERALRMLRSRSRSRAQSVDLALAEHAEALVDGRTADAATATRGLGVLLTDSYAADRLRVLDALYGGGDAAAARDAATRLAPDDCVRGQWLLATRAVAGVAGIVAALRRATPEGSGRAVVDAPPHVCAELLDVSLAVAQRRRDARARVQRLDSLALTPEVAGDVAQYAPLWIARLHERLGDAAGAASALERRPYMSGWPRYLTTIRRELALATRVE